MAVGTSRHEWRGFNHSGVQCGFEGKGLGEREGVTVS
jgi:hypothetical protein